MTAAGVVVSTAIAMQALAAPPEAPVQQIEGEIRTVAGSGPVDCRRLGYDFDVLQTALLTWHGVQKADGTRIRHFTSSGTVWRKGFADTTLTYSGRALVVDTPDRVRRISGLIWRYEDDSGQVVVQRAGRQLVQFGPAGPVELFTTPKAGVGDVEVCALLAELG